MSLSFATMPTSSTSSPVKRPGLGRRAVSSHAIVTPTGNSDDLSDPQKPPVQHHKPHRAHVVGRTHHRNPSGKNLNKLQRLSSQLNIDSGRHHQRKKSAPATPVASVISPKGHVRGDGALDDRQPSQSMKRNNSTPVLRRNMSGLAKKALMASRPNITSEKKKTVGFELVDDDNDDAEWEDTTQSPESTRRNSVAPSTHSVENTTVLFDPLTFVKRPYPQVQRAASLPDSITSKLAREDSGPDGDDQPDEEAELLHEHGDIANRLLSPSHSAKAPPAMSSISAMVKPTSSDSASRASFNLAAGQDGARRTISTSGLASMPGNQTQATSSSMEGGVSKFIVNNKSGPTPSRADSDPNTPSSFLPHYHPQTPPSPNHDTGKSPASPVRPRGTDPPSRTQQKLWLQRTAALNNSPPDSHGVSATAVQSAMDQTFGHSRPGSVTYDASRGVVNGSGRVGGADSEARHIRKAYEKTSLELMVVRRFQSPTGDSFNRLRAIARPRDPGQASSLGKPVKSAPSLTLLQHGKHPSRLSASPDSRQLVSPKVYFTNAAMSEDQPPNSESPATQTAKSVHPSHRIFSTSDETCHGLSGGGNDPDDELEVNESDMIVRRMWESREVATSG